jgi:hypothetical protein
VLDTPSDLCIADVAALSHLNVGIWVRSIHRFTSDFNEDHWSDGVSYYLVSKIHLSASHLGVHLAADTFPLLGCKWSVWVLGVVVRHALIDTEHR